MKKQEVERTRLEAEADKVRREKQSETQAVQRLIAAKAESDAMAFVLPLKEKEIKQKLLEAEADKGRRITEAEAQAEASKIHSAAEAARKRTMADAEAYAIRTTSPRTVREPEARGGADPGEPRLGREDVRGEALRQGAGHRDAEPPVGRLRPRDREAPGERTAGPAGEGGS